MSTSAPSRLRRRNRPEQRGSGTLLLLLVVVIMLSLVSSMAPIGRYLVVRDRARAAADLAALAGAQAYGSGTDGCAAARRYATRNGERLQRCDIAGNPTDFVLTVRIVAAVPAGSPIVPGEVVVDARAGPVQ